MSLLLRSIRSDGTINGSLSTAAVRDIVRRYGAMIGVPDLNPHDLRRSLARAARKAGAPLETIQKTLGHASTRTTDIYTSTGEEANAGDFIELTNSIKIESTKETAK
jgi:integrase